MSRRGHDIEVTCQHPGCSERGRYHYDSYRDADKSAAWRAKWRCIRHSGRTLSLDVPMLTMRVPSESSPETGERRYWLRSGYVHGPGFQAFADDFPPGTILEVTARIILPGTE